MPKFFGYSKEFNLEFMGLLIVFLTLVIVLNSLFLILLVLVQLPKKEAGAGQAFGGGTTDALFGAGSGNALTKLTKYSAGVFIVMAIMLSVLITNQSQRGVKGVQEELLKKSGGAPMVMPGAPTNLLQSVGSNTLALEATNITVTNVITRTSAPPAAPTAPTNKPAP
jgi:protein translocase SecG subunit